jgi:hypothetical protein
MSVRLTYPPHLFVAVHRHLLRRQTLVGFVVPLFCEFWVFLFRSLNPTELIFLTQMGQPRRHAFIRESIE